MKGLQIADFAASGFRAQLVGKEYFLDTIGELFEKNVEESQLVERFVETMIGIMLSHYRLTDTHIGIGIQLYKILDSTLAYTCAHSYRTP